MGLMGQPQICGKCHTDRGAARKNRKIILGQMPLGEVPGVSVPGVQRTRPDRPQNAENSKTRLFVSRLAYAAYATRFPAVSQTFVTV